MPFFRVSPVSQPCETLRREAVPGALTWDDALAVSPRGDPQTEGGVDAAVLEVCGGPRASHQAVVLLADLRALATQLLLHPAGIHQVLARWQNITGHSTAPYGGSETTGHAPYKLLGTALTTGHACFKVLGTTLTTGHACFKALDTTRTAGHACFKALDTTRTTGHACFKVLDTTRTTWTCMFQGAWHACFKVLDTTRTTGHACFKVPDMHVSRYLIQQELLGMNCAKSPVHSTIPKDSICSLNLLLWEKCEDGAVDIAFHTVHKFIKSWFGCPKLGTCSLPFTQALYSSLSCRTLFACLLFCCWGFVFCLLWNPPSTWWRIVGLADPPSGSSEVGASCHCECSHLRPAWPLILVTWPQSWWCGPCPPCQLPVLSAWPRAQGWCRAGLSQQGQKQELNHQPWTGLHTHTLLQKGIWPNKLSLYFEHNMLHTFLQWWNIFLCFYPNSDRVIIINTTSDVVSCLWCLALNGNSYPQLSFWQPMHKWVAQHATWHLLVSFFFFFSFLFLCCCFSYSTCTIYFVCVYIYIVSCYTCITFINIITFDYFVFT